mmetsp:Transcript_68873/g.139658  ORF Transcript_68873/g.139658 Transcript_68873/m.139658 type:complete len:104 (+) Transcript_68873:1940-2251(+)
MTKRLQLEQQLQLQLQLGQPQKNEVKSPVPLLWRRRQVLACLTKLNNKLQAPLLSQLSRQRVKTDPVDTREFEILQTARAAKTACGLSVRFLSTWDSHSQRLK